MFQLHTRFIIDLSAIIITLEYSEFGGTDGKESSCQCRRHKTCSFNPQSPWGWEEPQEKEMATRSRKIMDRGTWWSTVHGTARSRTQLSTLYYYTAYLNQWHLCFCVFLLLISILLFQPDRSFISSCEADLILMNSFSFHVSGKLLSFSSELGRILWVDFFFFPFFLLALCRQEESNTV